MDVIYENLVQQVVGGDFLFDINDRLEEVVMRQEIKQKLEKRFSVLEAKFRNEKQLNRLIELKTEVERMKIILKVYQNESSRSCKKYQQVLARMEF